MISYLEVYPLLAAACPSYEGSEREVLADERDGEFLRVGQLARHLIGVLAENKPEEFTAVFGVVEWVLAEGDSEARSLLTGGLIDDLTNPDFYTDAATTPHDLLSWL